MIIFTILLIALVLIVVIGALSIGIAGGASIILFGDVIIFGLIVYWIIKKIIKKKKK